jgi:hypothetical protein
MCCTCQRARSLPDAVCDGPERSPPYSPSIGSEPPSGYNLRPKQTLPLAEEQRPRGRHVLAGLDEERSHHHPRNPPTSSNELAMANRPPREASIRSWVRDLRLAGRFLTKSCRHENGMEAASGRPANQQRRRVMAKVMATMPASSTCRMATLPGHPRPSLAKSRRQRPGPQAHCSSSGATSGRPT